MKITGRPPKLSPECKATMVRLRRSGALIRDLVKLFRISRASVHRYLADFHKNPELRL